MSSNPPIPEMPKRVLRHCVKLNSYADIEQFITKLRAAYKHAKVSGGAYSAFAHPEGGPVLQVEIQVGERL